MIKILAKRNLHKNAIENISGHTLIEMAIAFMLIGVIFTPVLMVYNTHLRQQQVEQTKHTVDQVASAISGFRSVYGRYPCPADYDDNRDDVTYGHEDCAAQTLTDGNCTGIGANSGVCVEDSARTGASLPSPFTVMRGTVPFRILGLDESQAYDANGYRIEYAVTSVLTKFDTYDPNDGGISIVNDDDNSVIEPADTAHFVVFSPGEDGKGAFTRAGSQAGGCPASTVLEAENCNEDTVYRVSQLQPGYDDEIRFFSDTRPQYWQLQEADQNNMYLRKSSQVVVMGSTDATDLDADAVATAIDPSTITGSVVALKKAGSGVDGIIRAGKFVTPKVCLYGADMSGSADCFPTSLLTQQTSLGLAHDMKCPAGEFIYGIDNQKVQCTSEFYFSCGLQDGKQTFFKGVDDQNRPVCETQSGKDCPTQVKTSSCGEAVTIDGSYFGAHFDQAYDVTYSGTCYMIPDYDSSYFESLLAGKTTDERDVLVNDINYGPRTKVDCNTGPETEADYGTIPHALLRDTWQCHDGEWELATGSYASDGSYDNEIYGYGSKFPADVPSDDDYGEPGNPSSEDPTYGTGDDPYNVDGWWHDCWCREDYRTRTEDCAGHAAGTVYIVEKKRCPQTATGDGAWHEVYRDSSSCACVDYDANDPNQNCSNYYIAKGEMPASGYYLYGQLYEQYHYTCVGDVPQKADTPYNVVTSGCYCPLVMNYKDKVTCPPNYTNYFEWTDPYGNVHKETGLQSVKYRSVICPGGTGGAAAGHWSDWVTVTGPACTCDAGSYQYQWKPCPDNMAGGAYGKKYKQYYLCGEGRWEEESEYIKDDRLVENNCYKCTWQKPPGDGQPKEYGYDKENGSQCNCNVDTTGTCYENKGSYFDVWSGCSCTQTGSH